MLELQRELEERFRALQDSRVGPIFFIEHGLDEKEVAGAVADVCDSLSAHSLESEWWRSRSLPLLVAAAEVGYGYRGSGTDFWPALEAKLRVNFGASGRQRIRDLFASASETYRGARPPSTPWAQAFHLIAWPITHAMLPLEFHRPLALALANLRVNAASLTDDDLYRAIRVAASSASARFLTLLEDAALVVALARSLLGEGASVLCTEMMGRVAADLASDQVAMRGVAIARRIQRTAPKRSPSAPSRERLATTIGSLQLRRRDGKISLEASFPTLRGDIQQRLRRALRRRRYAARLWGISARIPSEQLLAGLPFAVKLTTVPPEDAELLPGLDEVDIDQELREALASFVLDVSSPLLFAVASDDGLGRRVRGPSISGHRSYWLLSKSGEGPHGCPTLGAVGPYDCHLIDPADATAHQELRHLGFHVRFGVSVAFAGAPALDRDATVPVFFVGDERLLLPRRASPGDLSVAIDERRVSVASDEVAVIEVERGDHTLRVSHGDEERQFEFRGSSSPPIAPPVACSIELRADDISVQALLRGTLSFSVDSFAPLEGLELTVSMEAGGQFFAATAPLGPLPCVVSPEQEPFATLLDDKTRALVARTHSLTLRLSVGNLCARSFELVHRVRPCWWRQTGDGAVALTSEVGDLPFGWILAAAPASTPVHGDDDAPEEVRLLVPVNLEASEYGGAAQFTSFCVAPSKMSLKAPAVRKPRLVRCLRGFGAALGLEELAESYLRWSLAESATLIAELRRRQAAALVDEWFVEVCCGDEWSRRELTLGCQDPWEALVRVCQMTHLGRDPSVELSSADEVELTRIAVREIRLEMPWLWARVGPPGDLEEDDYEALDLACGRAYTALAAAYSERGDKRLAEVIGDGDPGAAADEWDAALEQVTSSANFQPLAAMLIPSDCADGLMFLDPSTMTLDELVEELAEWARGARRALAGAIPSRDTLKAIVALWTEPELAVRLDWRAALDVLLAERAVARAARYLALRKRRINTGSSAS